MMDIGFIGLGAMGRYMAASLQQAGHALRVFALRRSCETVLQKEVFRYGSGIHAR